MLRNTQTHTSGKWQRRLDAANAAFKMHCGGIRSQEKKTTSYQEQDRQKVAAYQEEIKDIPPEKIVYVDESSIDTYLYREYGYAPQGQQVFGRIRGRKYQRCGIVAAQMGNRILAPFQYNGTMDSRLFEFWFSNQLLPSLEQGTRFVPFQKAAAFCCSKCRMQRSVSSTVLP